MEQTDTATEGFAESYYCAEFEERLLGNILEEEEISMVEWNFEDLSPGVVSIPFVDF